MEKKTASVFHKTKAILWQKADHFNKKEAKDRGSRSSTRTPIGKRK